MIKHIDCPTCDGSGEIENNGPKTCTGCGGNGTIEVELTDKEIIERLVQTLMITKNAIGKLIKMSDQEDVKIGAIELQKAIEVAIQANF